MTPSSPSRFKRGPFLALLRMARRRMRPSSLRFRTSANVLDHYVSGLPSAQTVVDCVPGWIGAMPPEADCVAGQAPLFADPRIAALLAAYDCTGRSVLELGAQEGFHTSMLHKAGAASIDAFESNALAFVRCLVTKEVLRLDRASFHLGDFKGWIGRTERRFDLIVASGVLDRSSDPVALLASIAARCEAMFLTAHYLDEGAMPHGDARGEPFLEQARIEVHHGLPVRLRGRTIDESRQDRPFRDAPQDRHVWIERGDILSLLGALGFGRLTVLDDQPNHRDGPCFALLAQRSPPPTDISGDAPDAA